MTEVKGSFRVNQVKWATVNRQFAALFLKDRILFVKVGGQFTELGLGGAVGAGVGGGLGAVIGVALEEALRKPSFKKRDEKIKNFSKMSVNELLKLDRHNLEISYKDINRIEIKKSLIGINGARIGVLKINGKRNEKFDIAPNQNFKDCEKIVKLTLYKRMRNTN